MDNFPRHLCKLNSDFGEPKLKLHDSGYTTPMVGTTRWRAPEVFEVEENRDEVHKIGGCAQFLNALL